MRRRYSEGGWGQGRGKLEEGQVLENIYIWKVRVSVGGTSRKKCVNVGFCGKVE